MRPLRNGALGGWFGVGTEDGVHTCRPAWQASPRSSASAPAPEAAAACAARRTTPRGMAPVGAGTRRWHMSGVRARGWPLCCSQTPGWLSPTWWDGGGWQRLWLAGVSAAVAYVGLVWWALVCCSIWWWHSEERYSPRPSPAPPAPLACVALAPIIMVHAAASLSPLRRDSRGPAASTGS